MKYKVVIKNNITGEMRKTNFFGDFHDYTIFYWQEGNGSCDCNRELEFERIKGIEVPFEDLKCGDERFSVPMLILENDQEVNVDLENYLC